MTSPTLGIPKKMTRPNSYGSMSSSHSTDDMIVHSQLYPYSKKILIEREVLIERENESTEGFQPPFSTSRFFGVTKCSCLLTVYVSLYVAYLVTGGLVFTALEAPMENKIRLSVIRAKSDFMQRFPNVDADSLEGLIEEVLHASERGVSALRNASSEPNWSFGQALFFSSTVVTTIGYGHVTPLTPTGKVFCMLYALVGIPLTLVLLSALVERLLEPATLLLQALNARLGHLYQPFNIRLLHLLIIVSIMVGVLMLIPAAVFTQLEPEWQFLDSFYYCFISLTTIGLGDYIPGDSPGQPYRPLYKVATTCYLFIGLTFMMLTLTVFYDIPQLNLGTVFATPSKLDLGADPEKMRLSGGSVVGPHYTVGAGAGDPYVRHCSSERRSVVRVRPHGDRDDSPASSPEREDTTPEHARDMRVH